MKFVGWLVYWILGSAALSFVCYFIENFSDMDNWSGFMRGVFIIGIIGWGVFLAWLVNQD